MAGGVALEFESRRNRTPVSLRRAGTEQIFMCGIAGKVYLDGQTPVAAELIQRMTDVIAHRGPDGQGQHVSGPVGLGHRRLSIIDLSPLGAQPMCNEDGSVWIVFNGEIYNYPELREELLGRGHQFRSGTDTEVIIHLFEEYGVNCLARLRGMFAFAIWDEKQKSLFIARDRVGIKPLYYTTADGAVVFGSEVKSLLVDPQVARGVNRAAVDGFLSNFYVPGEDTIFAGVQKLPPGHYLLIKDGRVAKQQYWELRYDVSQRWASMEVAAEALSDLLRRRVKDHMISDVPVGFLASGGVDSTALLSYAIEQTDKKISTFTVGFDSKEFADERPYARMAAQKFGTSHHDISMTAEDFRSFLPGYIWHMEEPVCEPPAIALYYVSKLARQHVTVLLSGEGGDEAFGGYPEYKNFLVLERFKSAVGPLRGLAATGVGLIGRTNKFRRAARYADLMRVPLHDYYFSRVASPFTHFNRLKADLYSAEFAQSARGWSPNAYSQKLMKAVGDRDRLNQMLFVDTKTWLPDDLLIKADKITMANSLELRVPFLDHEVLEFAAALPTEYKVRGRETKRVLKQAFAGRVPTEILTRKKTGFPVPYGRWLQRELRDYLHDTLLSQRALNRGYFQRAGVERLLRAEGDHAAEKFCLLVLELWHQRFVDL
jgi:asparagine synthase (glutamine-hydrolysing)